MFLVTPILSLQLISLNNSKAGWVGIVLEPDEDYNEIILHIRFKETDARLQQETLGILGSI
jgi:hypothetical protein